MFSVFLRFFETHCIKIGLDVRISLVRVLSTGRGEEAPPQKKVFPEKKFEAISNTDLL